MHLKDEIELDLQKLQLEFVMAQDASFNIGAVLIFHSTPSTFNHAFLQSL